jgi:pyruvate,orthophosphate dikinase
LCELERIGIPTPPAFILTVDASHEFDRYTKTLPASLVGEYCQAIVDLERSTGKVFGSSYGAYPLILCVRAGAPTRQPFVSADEMSTMYGDFREYLGMRSVPESLSFPGIQETVLGIGLNDMVCEYLCKVSSTRFGLNSYANFLMRFGTAVLKVPGKYTSTCQDTELYICTKHLCVT